MIRNIIHIIFSGVFLIIASHAGGQQAEALATLESDSLLIGDQVNLRFELTVPSDHLVSWPAFEDTLTQYIEIVKKTGVDTLPSDNKNLKTYFQNLLITGFDSGVYLVHPVRFFHGAKDDTVTELAETRPFYIRIHTVEVDTSKAIKVIKAPLTAPYTFAEALPWILGGMGIVLLGLLIFYYLKKRKSAESVFKIRSKPKLPAHIIALNDLEDLRLQKLWQAGRVKEYYTTMTDIVRLYIEDRFEINAVEMTTDEIMSTLRENLTDAEIKSKLGQTLTLADLVKFAKEKPLPLDNDNSLSNSIEFVKKTILIQEENTEETVKNNQETPAKVLN